MSQSRTAAGFRCPHAKTRLPLLFCCAVLLGVFPGETGSGSDRVDLFPKLHAGQTIIYSITFRSDKQTKTQSSVVVAQAPPPVQTDVRALLRLEILGVEAQGQRAVIHSRARFESLDADTQAKKQDTKETAVEFTIFPDGRVDQVTGLDALPPEQQQVWQQWASRFAAAAVFPQNGIKVTQKWKSEETLRSPSPIARLSWTRESTYVRNEPCRPVRITSEGDFVESDQPPEFCAVILTIATLKQQSPPHHPRRLPNPPASHLGHRPRQQQNHHLHFPKDGPRRSRLRRSRSNHERDHCQSRRLQPRPLRRPGKK
jgi:hypothetical protein